MQLSVEFYDAWLCWGIDAGMKALKDAGFDAIDMSYYHDACEFFLGEDYREKALEVEPLEEVVDLLTQQLKARHIQRLQAGKCTLALGFVFNDCINNFERVADHCSNLAIAVLEEDGNHLQPHDYLRSVKQADHEEYRVQLTRYAEKYYSKFAANE